MNHSIFCAVEARKIPKIWVFIDRVVIVSIIGAIIHHFFNFLLHMLMYLLYLFLRLKNPALIMYTFHLHDSQNGEKKFGYGETIEKSYQKG